MLYGYGGNILRIDLTNGTVATEPTDPKLAEKFLGGRGFGCCGGSRGTTYGDGDRRHGGDAPLLLKHLGEL